MAKDEVVNKENAVNQKEGSPQGRDLQNGVETASKVSHSKPNNNAQMPAGDMTYEIGHSGKDLPAMVRDMRKLYLC